MVSLVDGAVTLLVAGIPNAVNGNTVAADFVPDADDVLIFRGRVKTARTPARFVIVTDLDGSRSASSMSGRVDERTGGVRLTIAAVLPEGSTGSPDARAEWLADRCEYVLAGSKVTGAGAFRNTLTRFMGVDEGLSPLVNAYYVADFEATRLL